MRPFHRLIPLAALLTVGACSDNESPPAEDHTPVRYNLFIDGTQASAPYEFPSGLTVRVRLQLFNAADEDLDDVKSDHFAGLTFTPPSLATVIRVPNEHYQFNVTGGGPGSGTLQVSFGHDEAADETNLPAEAATVTGNGGGGGN